MQRANEYPRCRCELITAAETVDREVPGVDGLDCLERCLRVIGTELAGWNESVFQGQLRWEGSQRDGDIGLPTIDIERPAS